MVFLLDHRDFFNESKMDFVQHCSRNCFRDYYWDSLWNSPRYSYRDFFRVSLGFCMNFSSGIPSAASPRIFFRDFFINCFRAILGFLQRFLPGFSQTLYTEFLHGNIQQVLPIFRLGILLRFLPVFVT